jgi:hypothetical protein
MSLAATYSPSYNKHNLIMMESIYILGLFLLLASVLSQVSVTVVWGGGYEGGRCVCARVCVRACMRACVHACVRACVFVLQYNVYVCLTVCKHRCVFLCAHVYVHVCIHLCM